MNPWLIAAACLLGAGFMAWGAARLRLRWPLLALAVLLAAISVQLFMAAKGRDGFRDLAALVAQAFTVLPALGGLASGLLLAALQGHRLSWRGAVGRGTIVALLLAAAVAAGTFLL